MLSVPEKLEAAAAYIERRYAKSAYGIDPHGNVVEVRHLADIGIAGADEERIDVCLIGACILASPGNSSTLSTALYDWAEKHYHPAGALGLANWNDRPTTTAKMVADLFRDTAASLRAEAP